VGGARGEQGEVTGDEVDAVTVVDGEPDRALLDQVQHPVVAPPQLAAVGTALQC